LKAGKSACYVFTSMGTNVSAEEVCARAKGDYNKETNYNTNTFFNLKFFGKTAERFSKIGKKGLKIVIWGDIEEENYNSKEEARKSISITVDNFIPIFPKDAKPENGSNAAPSNKNNGQPAAYEEGPLGGLDDDDDEEIPF